MTKHILKIIKINCKLLQMHQVDIGGSTNNFSTMHSNLMLRKLLLLNYLEYLKQNCSNRSQSKQFDKIIRYIISDHYTNALKRLKSMRF